MRRCSIFALAFALVVGPARAASAEVPLDEAQLGAAAAELHALVDEAARAGLPADLLVDKAREGAAKNVPPARILEAVRSLGAAMASARREAQPFSGAAPPPSLVRALVAAHAAGASAADTQLVLRASGRERALLVLEGLVLRGCPATAAARAVSSLLGHERALEALVGEAERAQSLGKGRDAPALALDHADPTARDGDVADDDGRGPNRETSGARGPRSGGVAPPRPGENKNHS
jgi:hypothetical protein